MIGELIWHKIWETNMITPDLVYPKLNWQNLGTEIYLANPFWPINGQFYYFLFCQIMNHPFIPFGTPKQVVGGGSRAGDQEKLSNAHCVGLLAAIHCDSLWFLGIPLI
jgi:hypothetical protein